MRKGRLFVVATPIGNLEDMTFRAVRVLKEAGLIAAEDTRHTRKLLAHYGIGAPLTSYHEHNEREKAGVLLERLEGGTDVALVSDAGTPGISDPGYRIVRLALENSIEVVPVPGPSAIISLVSVSGLPTDEFTFKGFFPEKEGALRELLSRLPGSHTYIFYESPRRLKKTLRIIMDALGDVEIAVGRELTKVHEEVVRGNVSRVMDRLGAGEVKGEVTMAVRTPEEPGRDFMPSLRELLSGGARLNDAVKAVAADFGLPRAEVYKAALAIRAESREDKG